MPQELKDGDVHRLTGLKVEEVSIVDKPANQRPFLVVKRDMGAEIFRDENGELVTKKKQKPLSDKARRFLENIGAIDEDGNRVDHPKGKGKKKKSSVEDDDDEKDRDKQVVDKAGAKMNAANMEALFQAIEILGKLKGALEPTVGPSAGIATAKRADEKDGVLRLEKRVGDLDDKLSRIGTEVAERDATIQKQKKTISRQDEKLSQMKKSRQDAGKQIAAPSALLAEVRKSSEPESNEALWPMDLNREEKESEF